MMTTNHDWKCPIDGMKRVPYGANCPDYPACENAARAHVTGRWYRANAVSEVAAVGIAAISDEGNLLQDDTGSEVYPKGRQ